LRVRDWHTAGLIDDATSVADEKIQGKVSSESE
jgi:hypothetical protein